MILDFIITSLDNKFQSIREQTSNMSCDYKYDINRILDPMDGLIYMFESF